MTEQVGETFVFTVADSSRLTYAQILVDSEGHNALQDITFGSSTKVSNGVGNLPLVCRRRTHDGAPQE